MSILAQTMHRPLEPLSDVDMNLVKKDSTSQKKGQSSSESNSFGHNKNMSIKSQESSSSSSSSSSQNGSKISQSQNLKRKSDVLSNDDSPKAESSESAKKPKKRVSLINESGKEGEASSSSTKEDKRLEKEAKSEEKRKEKEAKEEEKRKEKEAKEEKRKEKEAKDEEKRKEREAKEDEKRKEREVRDQKRKDKEVKEEENRKIRQAKEEEKAKKDAEKAAKEAEKAAKEAEKEAKRNKEILQTKKAANFMSAFVQKPAGPSTSPKKQITEDISDFDRTFLPCTFKNRAPINRFERAIASDFDGCIGKSELVKDQLLNSFLTQSSKSKPDRAQTSKSRKGIRAPVSVRESMRLITEAGVLGDDRLLEENGKRGLANLADRKKLPVKLLHFASDRRPAWYGTWTRSSNFVSARKPLAQDPVALDYSYDSDAEWEDFDPMEGDDLNDNDDKEDDHESRSDSDSEMDDWLVDDLEEEEDEGELEMNMFGNRKSVSPVKSLKGRSRSSLSPCKPSVNKLDAKKKPKKFKPIGRRFETKLVKFETGPHWECELGVASYEGFNAYQMEMLNDSCIGLNPFTFTTTELQSADNTIPTSTIKSEQPEQIVNVLASSSVSTSPSNPNKSSVQATVLTKAKAFPEEHLKDLLISIEGSSSIRPVLIEGLHSKYATEGKPAVPKTTLEACLTTYAEKQSKKAGGKWVIKAEFRKMAGLEA